MFGKKFQRRKPSVEESCCSRMLPFADLLCTFRISPVRISPDIYFFPILAECFGYFLLVYKLNMIRSYSNDLEQNKIKKKRAHLR